jgi:hypothetical protein
VSFEFPDPGEVSAAFDWSRADRPVVRAKATDYFFLPPADAPGLAWAVKGLGAAPPFGLFCFGFLGSRPLRF